MIVAGVANEFRAECSPVTADKHVAIAKLRRESNTHTKPNEPTLIRCSHEIRPCRNYSNDSIGTVLSFVNKVLIKVRK